MIYPIDPRPIYARDPYVYWEGFLTPEDIQFILDRPEWNAQDDSKVMSGDGGQATDTSVRRSSVSWMGVDQENEHIWRKLADTVSRVNAQFFNYELTGFLEMAQLSTYSEEDKGCYDWHVDIATKDSLTPRKLSMTLLLSSPSDFEGGEFQIKSSTNMAETVALAQGRAWFFPSYMLHRVAPVTKGVRKSLVLWVGGPDFR